MKALSAAVYGFEHKNVLLAYYIITFQPLAQPFPWQLQSKKDKCIFLVHFIPQSGNVLSFTKKPLFSLIEVYRLYSKLY